MFIALRVGVTPLLFTWSVNSGIPIVNAELEIHRLH